MYIIFTTLTVRIIYQVLLYYKMFKYEEYHVRIVHDYDDDDNNDSC